MMLEGRYTNYSCVIKSIKRIKAYEVIRDTVGEKPTDKRDPFGELNKMLSLRGSGRMGK